MKNYLDLYIYGLQNYKNFSGRACRKEMIAFMLIIFGISILIGATTGLLLGFAEGFEDILGIDLPIIKVFANMLKTIDTLFIIAMLLPAYATGARRLHDINLSGWVQLISFIPVIGNVTLFVLLFCIKGSDEKNNYGEPSVNY